MPTENIIYKKEQGYSLSQILKSETSFNPFLDEMLLLNKVVRVCNTIRQVSIHPNSFLFIRKGAFHKNGSCTGINEIAQL